MAKKNYSVELLEDNELKTSIDYDLNELKLSALISDIEKEIILLRLKKNVLLKNRLMEEKNKVPTPVPPQKTAWEKLKETIKNWL